MSQGSTLSIWHMTAWQTITFKPTATHENLKSVQHVPWIKFMFYYIFSFITFFLGGRDSPAWHYIHPWALGIEIMVPSCSTKPSIMFLCFYFILIVLLQYRVLQKKNHFWEAKKLVLMTTLWCQISTLNRLVVHLTFLVPKSVFFLAGVYKMGGGGYSLLWPFF